MTVRQLASSQLRFYQGKLDSRTWLLSGSDVPDPQSQGLLLAPCLHQLFHLMQPFYDTIDNSQIAANLPIRQDMANAIHSTLLADSYRQFGKSNLRLMFSYILESEI